MTLREYTHRVSGYTKEIEIRRSEMRALFYPIYANTFAALGSKSRPMTPSQYMPIGEESKPKEPLTDPDNLIKKAYDLWNRKTKK